jgi:hypothetical protein
MEEKVITRMRADAPLNMEKAEKIANEFGLKTKSVIASATRRGIPYERKARVGKTGEKPETKESMVARIAEKYGIELDKLNGLEKANKEALVALLE